MLSTTALKSHVQSLGRRVVDVFFPPRCVGCGRGGVFLCPDCRGTLPVVKPPVCDICGRPLILDDVCSACRRWRLQIKGIRAPYRFEGVIRGAIHKLKYHNFRALAPSLAELLANHLQSKPLAVDVLVPVPLHPKRLRQRGYNQSALLAKELGKLIGLPVVDHCLCRVRNTPSQTRANLEARRSNVLNAFHCADRRIEGRSVLLVDDVCTTGATLDSCAAALKEGGASEVWGLTLAREI